MYKQLYSRYCEAISTGKLRPGDRVPSVRCLASDLNLARGTVEAAYQMLIGEGFFITSGAAGTMVAPLVGQESERQSVASRLPYDNVLSAQERVSLDVMPFQLGLPALDVFPRKTWTRLAARNLRELEMTTPDPAGLLRLRCAIAKYVGISRGIACNYDQVFVTVGYRGALELICRALLRPGNLGWFEEPGYFNARLSLIKAGLRLHPVPVDANGMNIALGEREAPEARFAVVTPTHHSPLGVAMSMSRRLRLLDWAERNGSWIIEDDYDSEFHFRGRPLPTIKSLDQKGRVLYTGTFSKTLFSGLRLAYLIVPESQVDRFRTCVAYLSGAGNAVPQATVADFMEQGHFARHLNRMRKVYAERQCYLVKALSQHLGERLSVRSHLGGMHVFAHLREGIRDRDLEDVARRQGLAVNALSRWCAMPTQKQGVILGYTNFTTYEHAQMAVKLLGRIWPNI